MLAGVREPSGRHHERQFLQPGGQRLRPSCRWHELDRRLKFIEADNGRYAPERKGLPLDIDVLLYDGLVGSFDGLQLPRAEILRNAFVLWPLALLAPGGARIRPRPANPSPSSGQRRRSTSSCGRYLSPGAASS